MNGATPGSIGELIARANDARDGVHAAARMTPPHGFAEWCSDCHDRMIIRRPGAHVLMCRCTQNRFLNEERERYGRAMARELAIDLAPRASDANDLGCGACRDTLEIGDTVDTVRRCPCTWILTIVYRRLFIIDRLGPVPENDDDEYQGKTG